MSKRIAIAGVSERDIDLLLLEEFQASESFREWFVAQVHGDKVSAGPLLSAHRSITQTTGESDLEVTFGEGTDKATRYLIENKVGAGFQRQQADRYRKRGRDYVDCGDCATCHTVLVAPERYFGSDESTKSFDAKVKYEAILRWFEGAEDLGERRKYKTELLRSAIEKGRLGYQPEEDAPVTEFWQTCWLLARDHAPRLEMKEPLGKPASASFVSFRPASLPRGVTIWHKLCKGYVDLQVKGMGDQVNEWNRALRWHLCPEMQLTSAGKSAAVRIIVPELAPGRPLEDQREGVLKGLAAATTLLQWFLGLPRSALPRRPLPTPGDPT